MKYTFNGIFFCLPIGGEQVRRQVGGLAAILSASTDHLCTGNIGDFFLNQTYDWMEDINLKNARLKIIWGSIDLLKMTLIVFCKCKTRLIFRIFNFNNIFLVLATIQANSVPVIFIRIAFVFTKYLVNLRKNRERIGVKRRQQRRFVEFSREALKKAYLNKRMNH